MKGDMGGDIRANGTGEMNLKKEKKKQPASSIEGKIEMCWFGCFSI